MNIVYSCSDLFAEICGVSIYSLFSCNKYVPEIVVYIFDNGITQESKEKLNSIAIEFNRTIVYIPMPKVKDVYPDVDMDLGHTFTRMVLGRLLPQNIHRVLSLDSDTVIMDSLQELYDTDLGSNCIGGVYDCVGKAIQKDFLHADDDIDYCNAGVFLIDLDKWRKDNVEEDMMNLILRERDKIFFLEQDVMNRIFAKKLTLLHPRYNMISFVYCFNYDEVMKMKKPVKYYERQLVEDAQAKPAILHATTCFYIKKRMWIAGSDHPYAKFYNNYRQHTPWRNEPLMADNRKLSKKINSCLWHLLPRPLVVLLATFLINELRPIVAKLSAKVSYNPIANQS